jgi:hypothetical protein
MRSVLLGAYDLNLVSKGFLQFDYSGSPLIGYGPIAQAAMTQAIGQI